MAAISSVGDYLYYNSLVKLDKKLVRDKFSATIEKEIPTFIKPGEEDISADYQRLLLELMVISIMEPIPFESHNFDSLYTVWSKVFKYVPRESKFSGAKKLLSSEVEDLRKKFNDITEIPGIKSFVQNFLDNEIEHSNYAMVPSRPQDDDPNFIPKNKSWGCLGKIFPANASLQK